MNKPSALINLVRIAIAQGHRREEAVQIAKNIMEQCNKNGVVLSWEGSKQVADALWSSTK
jgi:hypothetical protein